MYKEMKFWIKLIFSTQIEFVLKNWALLEKVGNNQKVLMHRVVDRGILSHISNMNFQFWAVLGSLTFWVFNDTNLQLTRYKDF